MLAKLNEGMRGHQASFSMPKLYESETGGSEWESVLAEKESELDFLLSSPLVLADDKEQAADLATT